MYQLRFFSTFFWIFIFLRVHKNNRSVCTIRMAVVSHRDLSYSTLSRRKPFPKNTHIFGGRRRRRRKNFLSQPDPIPSRRANISRSGPAPHSDIYIQPAKPCSATVAFSWKACLWFPRPSVMRRARMHQCVDACMHRCMHARMHASMQAGMHARMLALLALVPSSPSTTFPCLSNSPLSLLDPSPHSPPYAFGNPCPTGEAMVTTWRRSKPKVILDQPCARGG